jgi:transcriptional regulator with XRE-family HTH domain
MDVNKTIGQRLRETRIKKGNTAKEVAEATGISSTAISQIETNKNKPSVDNLVDLASYYDVTTDYILGIEKLTDRFTIDLLETYTNLTDGSKIQILVKAKELEAREVTLNKINKLKQKNRPIILIGL